MQSPYNHEYRRTTVHSHVDELYVCIICPLSVYALEDGLAIKLCSKPELELMGIAHVLSSTLNKPFLQSDIRDIFHPLTCQGYWTDNFRLFGFVYPRVYKSVDARLSIDQVYNAFMMSLSEAIEIMQSLSYSHSDIALRNIMINFDGKARLIDCGLFIRHGTFGKIGLPVYASHPSIFETRYIDGLNDRYAYWMLLLDSVGFDEKSDDNIKIIYSIYDDRKRGVTSFPSVKFVKHSREYIKMRLTLMIDRHKDVQGEPFAKRALNMLSGYNESFSDDEQRSILLIFLRFFPLPKPYRQHDYRTSTYAAGQTKQTAVRLNQQTFITNDDLVRIKFDLETVLDKAKSMIVMFNVAQQQDGAADDDDTPPHLAAAKTIPRASSISSSSSSISSTCSQTIIIIMIRRKKSRCRISYGLIHVD